MLRIGIIGAGGNGRGHARYYHKCPRSNVVAIADPDAERAKAVAEEVGAKAVADYTEFLDEVDAVVISSPNFLHRDHALACAGAGKHILCEKPMGLNLHQAQEITDAVEMAGVKSMVGFSVSFSDSIQTMQKYLREGRLGALISVWSRRLMYMDPARARGWRADQALSGGILYEVNIHELEWMMRLGGDVTSVYGRTWARERKTPRDNDHVWFILNFEGGAVGSHEGSQASPSAEYQRGIIGQEGGMITDRWGRGALYTKAGQKEAPADLEPGFDKHAHFLDCIENDAEPVADVHWGLKVMAAAEAVIQSAISGEVVHL